MGKIDVGTVDSDWEEFVKFIRKFLKPRSSSGSSFDALIRLELRRNEKGRAEICLTYQGTREQIGMPYDGPEVQGWFEELSKRQSS